MKTGHVRKKMVNGKARWYVVIELAPGPDGKRRQKNLGGHATRREADKALRQALTQAEEGTYVEPSKLTVGQWLTEKWLPTQKDALRPNTFDSYERQLLTHVIPRLGHIPLQALRPDDLDALYAKLRESGRRDGQGGLSVRSVAYIHVIVHKALKAAVAKKRLPANPADAAEPPRQRQTGSGEMKVWTGEQLAAFLRLTEGERLFSAILLLALTGMRRGEALGLRWSDVDLEAGRLSVRRSLVVVDHALIFSTPKTAKGVRSIDLEPRTITTLRAWRKRQMEERLACGADYEGSDLVFTTEVGAPVHPTSFSNVFDRLVRSSGLPRITVHGLRHTCATILLGQGVHPKVVQELLGHSSIAVTLDTYSHLLPSMAKGTTSKVAAAIWGTA